LAVALGVFAFLSFETFGIDAVFMDGHGLAALAAAARDPLSLIDKRSPGQRKGDLNQLKSTKNKRPPALAQRGGPKPPPGPPAEVTDHPTGEGLPPPAPVFAIKEVVPPPPGAPENPFPLTVAPPEPVPQETPGSGGPVTGGPDSGIPIIGIPVGGGGLPPPTTVVTIDNPGAPGIPEPSVWATLIVGFFGIGAALRLRRRAQARLRADVGA